MQRTGLDAVLLIDFARFVCSDVHCDPHAANMLVRHDKKGKPQLVLLDHGLYKELSEELRLEYAGLWQALIFGDEAVRFTVASILNFDFQSK